jgi:hypothetical protein
MHVGDITFTSDSWSLGFFGRWCRATVSVLIRDALNNGISDATVSGRWTGAYSRSVSGATDSQGVVSFTSGWVRYCGKYTFTVDEVQKSGWIYDAASNVETSDSIILS